MTKEELKAYLISEGAETEEAVESMSNWDLFDRYLTWNGLIGWTDGIIDAYKAAFEPENDV